MRIREFFLRTGLFLPMAIFGILFLLMVVGIGSEMIGAKLPFYCSIYCKVSVALLGLGALAVIACQAFACRANR